MNVTFLLQMKYITNVLMHFTYFWAGSTKKGNDHIIQSVKLSKVNGSVISVNINQSTGHLAVGSSKGYVSLLSYNYFSDLLLLPNICLLSGFVELVCNSDPCEFVFLTGFGY